MKDADEQRDVLFEALGIGISRRTMLKRLGLGIGGAALAPSVNPYVFGATGQEPRGLGAALPGYSPQHVWDYTLPQPGPRPYDFATGNPVFNNGALIIPTHSIDESGSILYSLDTQTKQVWWQHIFANIGDLGMALVADGVIYLRDIQPGNLYAIDSTTGNVHWQKAYQLSADPLLADGRLISPTNGGGILAVDLEGNQLWSSNFSGVTGTTRAVASGGVVMAMKGGTLFAADLQTGSLKWQYSLGDGSARDTESSNLLLRRRNRLFRGFRQ
jgi:outer membrane protein assembly factor BamB